MLDTIRSGVETFRRDGTRSFLKATVRHLRGKLGRVPGTKDLYAAYVRPSTRISHERVVLVNGVSYNPDRTLDRYLPWEFLPAVPEEFEAGTVDALEHFVQEGDDVVVVGGGRGVTSVVAARQAGENGTVVAYEGARHLVDDVRNTATLNAVADRIDVRHGIVGTKERLDGPSRGAPVIDGGSLPPCDVLEMDCEGAETDILPRLEIRPRTIIVESHGNRDEIVDQLNQLGYALVSERPAETHMTPAEIERGGLYTLVAQ